MGARGKRMPSLRRGFVALLFVALVLLVSAATAQEAESAHDCLNVEEPGYEGGDRQCFGTDKTGMVCGWDGDKKLEAYCEVGSRGLKVCARKRGGGRCTKEHGNTPVTDKAHDVE